MGVFATMALGRPLAQRGVGWSEAFARACLLRPDQSVHVDPAFTLVEELPNAEIYRAHGAYPGMGSVTKLPGFDSGKFIVQDLSSQFLQAKSQNNERRRRVDSFGFCVAPGGKSVGLA